MRFVCVPCNTPMKLESVGAPEAGSLTVVFSCPKCGYEMSMLTNPYETELVQSLGVRIGPSTGQVGQVGQVGQIGQVGRVGQVGADAQGARCPFPGMIPATEAAQVQSKEPGPLPWTPGAEARFANVPAFVRPMARTGIERFARERGAVEVDEKILDAARDFFGM